jgi:hypothetical protein
MLMLLIVGCQSLSPLPQPLATISSLPPTATQTITPAPTETPTFAYKLDSISFESPGKWHFGKPYVFKDWPNLIVPDGDVFKLDEGYDVQSIELSYQWWGMGDPVFNYQQIKKSGSRYLLSGKVIPEEKVENLLKAIKNLHLTPQILSSVTHTDDYPLWAVEVTGVDGTRFLLTSISNTASYVPWNVVYNGETYAQFDGSVPSALADLFSVSEGQPSASFFPGGSEEGKLIVSSSGWPNQFTYGFNGLLPIYTSFNYQANSKTGKIEGVFDGRSSIGGFGNMIIGSITKLEKIVMEKTDKSKVNCSIESLKNDNDPSAVQWSFVCPVEQPDISGSYLYPLNVTFGTDKGEKITTEGNLFGYWESNILLPQPLFPPEIVQALSAYEPYQTLARDHQVVLLNFDAKVDQLGGRLDEATNIDIVLLGQLNIDGKKLPYSVNSSFGVENGKIVRFDLDLTKLESLITDVLKQPVTKNILSHTQDAVLNLYYYEYSNAVDIGFSQGMNHSGKNWNTLAKCEGLPWRKKLPDETTPLRGFGVNQSWNANPQFILLDDAVRLLNYYSDLPASPGSSLGYLLPEQLNMNGRKPLGINGYFDFGAYVQLGWGENTKDDKDAYIAAIKQLPGKKEFFDWGATLDDAVFVVNERGTLDLVECKQTK